MASCWPYFYAKKASVNYVKVEELGSCDFLFFFSCHKISLVFL